ncbi:PH and SEC7 domain-containing protein [Smittium mucronatum]|uniref:PH and SEC7 domain-containing protein n=1 Tax=Smittium mucronatum TaxID=133383 RepID=A0A1R0GWN0_9FUNG|nr:PH and SEC7 domain-containing protein [Smittium mucronatum]
MNYKIPGSEIDIPENNSNDSHSLNNKLKSPYLNPNDIPSILESDFSENKSSYADSSPKGSSVTNLDSHVELLNKKKIKKNEKKYVEVKASEGYRWIMSKLRKDTGKSSIISDSSKRTNSISQSVRGNTFLKRNVTIDSNNSSSLKLKTPDSSNVYPMLQGPEESSSNSAHNKLRKPSFWSILKQPIKSNNENSADNNGSIDSTEKLSKTYRKDSLPGNILQSKNSRSDLNMYPYTTPSSNSIFSNSDVDLNANYELYGLLKNPKIDQANISDNKSASLSDVSNSKPLKIFPASHTSENLHFGFNSLSINKDHPDLYVHNLPDNLILESPSTLNLNSKKSAATSNIIESPVNPISIPLPENVNNSERVPLALNYSGKHPVNNAEFNQNHLYSNSTPEDFSRLIYNYYSDPSIVLISPLKDPSDFAEFLGGRTPFQIKTLELYMSMFSFSKIRLDAALRKVCSRLLMLAESQVIDRILKQFSKNYFYSNPDTQLKSVSNTHTVAFSIFLLNTDLHLADIKPSARMSKAQYVRNTIEAINMNSTREKSIAHTTFVDSGKISDSLKLLSNYEPEKSMVSPYTEDNNHINDIEISSSLPKYHVTSPNSPITSYVEEFILNIPNSSKSTGGFISEIKSDPLGGKFNIIRGRSQSRTYVKGKAINADIVRFKASSVDPFYFSDQSPKSDLGSSYSNANELNKKGHQITSSKSELNISKDFNLVTLHEDSSFYPHPSKNVSPNKNSFQTSNKFITTFKNHSYPRQSDDPAQNNMNLNSSLANIPSNSSKYFFGSPKNNSNPPLMDLNISSYLRDIYSSIKENPLEKPIISSHSNNSQERAEPSSIYGLTEISNNVFSDNKKSMNNYLSRFSTGVGDSFNNSNPNPLVKQQYLTKKLSKSKNIVSEDLHLHPSKRYELKTSMDARNSLSTQSNYSSKAINYVNSFTAKNQDFSDSKEPSPSTVRQSSTITQGSNFPKIIDLKYNPISNNPVASKLYFRCGLLNRKILFDSYGKKPSNRSWRGCYLSIANGKAMMYKGDNSSAPRIGLVGSLPSDVPLLNSIYLVHSYSQVMPKPGYSYTKPHVFALTLNDGSVYLFQTFEAEEANQWSFACNYWAALFTKVPYIAGSVNNSEYGWYSQNNLANRSNSMMELGIDSKTNGSKMSVLGSISFSTKKLDKIDSVKDSNRHVNISDWAPPPNPTQLVFHDEKSQIEAFSKHIDYLDNELNTHKTALAQINERFHEKSLVYNRAFNNWEKKAQYLLKELIKYKNYIDCLKAAIKESESLNENNIENIARTNSNVETLMTSDNELDASLLTSNTRDRQKNTSGTTNSSFSKPIPKLRKSTSSKIFDVKQLQIVDKPNQSRSSPKKLNSSVSFSDESKAKTDVFFRDDLNINHNRKNGRNNETQLIYSYDPGSFNLGYLNSKSDENQPLDINKRNFNNIENDAELLERLTRKSMSDPAPLTSLKNESEYSFLRFLTPTKNLRLQMDPVSESKTGDREEDNRLEPLSIGGSSKLTDLFKPLDISSHLMDLNPSSAKVKRNSSPIKPQSHNIDLTRLLIVKGKKDFILSSPSLELENRSRSHRNSKDSSNGDSKLRISSTKNKEFISKAERRGRQKKNQEGVKKLSSIPNSNELLDENTTKNNMENYFNNNIHDQTDPADSFEGYFKDYEYLGRKMIVEGELGSPSNLSASQSDQKNFGKSSLEKYIEELAKIDKPYKKDSGEIEDQTKNNFTKKTIRPRMAAHYYKVTDRDEQYISSYSFFIERPKTAPIQKSKTEPSNSK